MKFAQHGHVACAFLWNYLVRSMVEPVGDNISNEQLIMYNPELHREHRRTHANRLGKAPRYRSAVASDRFATSP